MAVVDTSSIEGYADMTAEEKVAALEAYNYPDPDYSGYVKKELFDEKANEVAALKNAEKPVSEDSQKVAALSDTITALQKQVATLTRDKKESEHKARFIGLGYNEELAAATAKAMVDGDMDTVFKNQQLHMEQHDRDRLAEVMRNTPMPAVGSGSMADLYQKQIDEALNRGDIASAVHYINKQ